MRKLPFLEIFALTVIMVCGAAFIALAIGAALPEGSLVCYPADSLPECPPVDCAVDCPPEPPIDPPVVDCGPEPLAWDAGMEPTATRYVDGAASCPGEGSSERPWCSLAVARPIPGTELLVTGDVTNGAAVTFRGAADAPIWVRQDPDGAPAILYGDANVAPYRLSSAAYLVTEDVEIAGSPTGGGPDHCIHFDDSSHLTFRRVYSHRCTEAALKGSQSDHFYLEDSELADAGYGQWGDPQASQVLDLVGVNDGHIIRSKIHSGPHILVVLKGGTSDVLLWRNEIYDMGSGQSAAVHLGQWTTPGSVFQPSDAEYECLRCVAWGNLVHDVGSAPFAAQGCHDCAIVHSTGWNFNVSPAPLRWLAGKNAAGGTSYTEGTRVSGNIFDGVSEWGVGMEGDGVRGDQNGEDHNWFAGDLTQCWGAMCPFDITDQLGGDPGLDSEGRPSRPPGVGASDLGSLPFSRYLNQDYAGECVTLPTAIGAYSTTE